MVKRKSNNTGMVVGVVVVIAVVLLILGLTGTFQNIGTTTIEGIEGCPDSTGAITWASENSLSKSSAVTAISYNVKADGSAGATNTTTYAVGGKLEYLASADDYLADVFTDIVPCGGKTITTGLTATDRPSVSFINSGGDTVTNGTDAGATNFSAIANGGSDDFQIKIVGTDKKSTGNMVLVLEMNSSVDSITINGVSGSTAKPEIYSNTVTTNPKVFVFDIPAVEGATNIKLDGVMTMKSGEHYNGTIMGVFYSKQSFQDTNGLFIYGIEDSDGTAKFEDATTFAGTIAP